MIRTIWQPAYTPPGFSHVEYIDKGKRTTQSRILAYLVEHGITSRAVLVDKLCITSNVFRHSMVMLRGKVEFEQSGSAKDRVAMYWAVSHPPPIEKRCASHQLWDWYRANPWSDQHQVPEHIYSAGKNKRACIFYLEESKRLISRVRDGVKQYKVAA